MNSKSKLIKSTLRQVSKVYKGLGIQKDTLVLCTELGKFFGNLESNQGTKTAVKTLKSIYGESTRFASGLPIQVSTEIWLRRDRYNYPLALRSFKTFLRGSKLERKCALSLLRVFEVVTLSPVKDISTITEPSSGGDNWNKVHSKTFKSFLKISPFGQRLKKMFEGKMESVLEDRESDLPKLHFTSKKGVKGPSIGTLHTQARSVIRQSRIGEVDNNLISKLEEFAAIFGRTDWKELLLASANIHPLQVNVSGAGPIPLVKDIYKFKNSEEDRVLNYLGKISFLPDKGGKTRIVAIGNYWIQELLKELHDILYSILRDLPCDGTYDQESQASRVKESTLTYRNWSYDLSAATDRTPIEPQVEVLNHLMPGLGDKWMSIIQGIGFVVDSEVIYYKVGQPMGLYSSWATFTLTHHCLTQYSAWLEGLHEFEDYAILGDDFSVWNERVAYRYSCIMTSTLNVKVNKQKSYEPDPSCPDLRVAEFAKRVFVNGEEITGTPPGVITNAYGDIGELPTLLLNLTTKGINSAQICLLRLLNEVYTFKCKSEKFKGFAHKLVHISELCQNASLWDVKPTSVLKYELNHITKDVVLEARIALVSEKIKKPDKGDFIPPDYFEACKRLGFDEVFSLSGRGPLFPSMEDLMSPKQGYSSPSDGDEQPVLEQKEFTFPSDPVVSFRFYLFVIYKTIAFTHFTQMVDLHRKLKEAIYLINEAPEEEPDDNEDINLYINALEFIPLPKFEKIAEGFVDNTARRKMRNSFTKRITSLIIARGKAQEVLNQDEQSYGAVE